MQAPRGREGTDEERLVLRSRKLVGAPVEQHIGAWFAERREKRVTAFFE